MTANAAALKKYAGPQIPSLLRYLFQICRDPPDQLYNLAQEYGTTVRLRLGPRPVFFVTGSKGVEHILQNNQHNYRGFNYSHVKLRPLLGNGLLTSEGETWLKHRRLAQQAFHHDQLEKLSQLMTVTIKNFLERWQAQTADLTSVDISAEMGLMTLGVVTEALFGTKMGARALQMRDAWLLVLKHLVRRMINPLHLPEQLPFYGNLQYQKSMGLLNQAVYLLISEYRAASQTSENLLGMLIAARDQQLDIQLDDQELRDEVMTILLAGHETCANALTWALYLLASHPEVQERLAEEASAPAGREPGYANLEHRPYAAMVFNEALRLYPPAWIMARDVLQADEMEGWHIPAGSLVFLSPYVTHRRAENWSDPLAFNPLRFSPENSAGRPRFAYFPFGGGQRQCLGKNFALIEAQLALPLMVQKYRFSPADEAGPRNTPYPIYNMHPQKTIFLKLEKR